MTKLGSLLNETAYDQLTNHMSCEIHERCRLSKRVHLAKDCNFVGKHTMSKFYLSIIGRILKKKTMRHFCLIPNDFLQTISVGTESIDKFIPSDLLSFIIIFVECIYMTVNIWCLIKKKKNTNLNIKSIHQLFFLKCTRLYLITKVFVIEVIGTVIEVSRKLARGGGGGGGGGNAF